MRIFNSKFYLLSKQHLLYVATIVWLFAGLMLISRGANQIYEQGIYLLTKSIIAVVSGLLFYFLMFRKISMKHILRIMNMTENMVPFYAFFNRRSYFMMISMILLGIIIRKTGFIPIEYLSVFYISMGLPLFISSIRFLYYAINYNKSQKII